MVQEIPKLTGDAKKAVEYRDGHLQIIASAGSGKTEVVSQRVAALLAEGVSPDAIIAFTFTERAAASLKSRIEKRVENLLGVEFLDRLNGMFVGTIHAYCFRLLQQYVPRYEAFDVLDTHRLTAFLTREAYSIGVVPKVHQKLFKGIQLFGASLEVIENELLEPAQLNEPLKSVYEDYLDSLDDHRFLTYGQQITRAVDELGRPAVYKRVHDPLRHLIVDEYQDINPAQEHLIKLLSKDPVHLCVVGDDDQSIYQWRGSDVANITTFATRYRRGKRLVESFEIGTNRRSRPEIIRAANGFAKGIDGRLPKSMRTHRESAGHAELVTWSADTPDDEAELIAHSARHFHERHHYRYRDIAILCRTRSSFEAILSALQAEGVPVQPGGRTSLFMQPEADVFGRTLCWLVDYEWRIGTYGWTTEAVTLDALMREYGGQFGLDPKRKKAVRARLIDWKSRVDSDKAPANLVGEYYELLGELGVAQWNHDDPWTINRLGTLARCSQLLVDYESTRRRARPDLSRPGDVMSGQDRGRRYYEWLARYLQNWAQGAYEDFEGEEDVTLDAVDLTTVHQAKGLEWPIVFVPALTDIRFPPQAMGRRRETPVPRGLYDAVRYEGSENDERRLFYVAMTRARDYLSLSTFAAIHTAQRTSRFLLQVAGGEPARAKKLPRPHDPEPRDEEEEVLSVTFSDLAAYLECGLSYRMRRLVGFQPPIAAEIGYGRAVHHVMRHVAEFVREHNRTPLPDDLDRIFADAFFLPMANRPAQREMRGRARELVDLYIEHYEQDLHNVWAVERPFELHLGDATVSGRADVIIKQQAGEPDSLSIVDYKTAAAEHDSYDFQLQVYTDAGRREGLQIDSAFVHDLRMPGAGARRTVGVTVDEIEKAEDKTRDLVARLRAKSYVPQPSPELCIRCDVQRLCAHRAQP